MSTRSVITVIDEHDRFSIYRYYDGYPDGDGGVIASIPLAFPFAWPLPRFEAMDFAAAIIAAWKDKGGGNIYCTTGRDHHHYCEFYYEIALVKSKLYVKVFKCHDGTQHDLAFEGTLEKALAKYK